MMTMTVVMVSMPSAESSASASSLLPPLPCGAAAAWAVEPRVLHHDPVQALPAAPPALARVAVVVPVVPDLDAARLDILPVVAPQVVAEVVLALEGLDRASALGVVAVDAGELRCVVDVVPVALEVGSALEGRVTHVAADGRARAVSGAVSVEGAGR